MLKNLLNKSLLFFVKYGEKSFISLLLKLGMDIDLQDNKGLTPLMVATLEGRFSIVKYLIEKGADIHKKDCLGKTFFVYAVEKGDLNVVQYCCDRNLVDIDIELKNGLPILPIACSQGRLEIVKCLMEHHKKSAQIDDLEAAMMCAYASQEGHLDIVRYLHEQGMDINSKDTHGRSALHYASLGGSGGVVEYLLDHGGDVNVRGPEGETPLAIAAFFGQMNVADILLQRGADIDSKLTDGSTVLMAATNCSEGADLITKLCELGVDVDEQDNYGRTATIYAVMNKNKKALSYLSSWGANFWIKDNKGKDATDYAEYLFDRTDVFILGMKAKQNKKGRQADKEQLRTRQLSVLSQKSYEELTDEKKSGVLFQELQKLNALGCVLESKAIDDYEKLKKVYRVIKSYSQNDETQKQIREVFTKRSLELRQKNDA